VKCDFRWNGGIYAAGAVTLLRSDEVTAGNIGLPDTVLGTTASGGGYMGISYDPLRARIIVHQSIANRFTLLSHGNPILTGWRTDHFAPATAGTAHLEDFDHDGVSNLMEFSFGTAPDDASIGSGALEYNGSLAGGGTLTATGHPVIARLETPAGPEFRALFTRRRDYLLAGLNYVPQFSSNFNSWQDSTANPLVLADNGSHQIVSVPWPAAAGGTQPRFFRIRVNVAAVNRK
jgi:hypothetical protein